MAISKRKVVIGAAVAVATVLAVIIVLYVMLPNSPLRIAGVSGIYDVTSLSSASQSIYSKYIELKPDGTMDFWFGDGRYKTSGTWELKNGNSIYVKCYYAASALKTEGYLRIEGNNLIDETGTIYTRRG